MTRARRVPARWQAAFAVPSCSGFFLGLWTLLAPVVAHAQQPGQPPPLPMAVDLKKVPVGVWAEYDMSVGKLPPMKARMALVAKGDATNTLEMIMQGGMIAMSGGKLTMQTIIDANQDSAEPVKKVIMQIGDNEPMEMPVDSKQQSQFHRPDPKTLLKQETITVAAGKFKTKHYRDKTPTGEPFDFWVSADVPPFGLVKVESEQKNAAGPAQGKVRFELTALGKDAKMVVTKVPKPFNQSQMMGQLMGGAKGPGGAMSAPPPPARTPTPAPAK
jgi:hypothetical protein